ncbi:MAG: hypothetical protein V2A73_04700, partial [Pseudomonadota bacterium]
MGTLALLALANSAGSCVVPLPWEASRPDAGVNSTPIIRSSNPSMPGASVVLDKDTLGSTFTISVSDRDLGDRICVRVFRDYDRQEPTPPWSAT